MNNKHHKILTIELKNQRGLHARPSADFVNAASKFKSSILVEVDHNIADGKSILGLLMLGAGHGSKLKITADGPDAPDAIHCLERLISKKFGED